MLFREDLSAARPFQIGDKKEQINRRENRIDSKGNQEKADPNQPAVSKPAADTVSENLAFGKNLHIGHQVVVGADRAPAMTAKPRVRRLRGGAMMANLLRLRFR